jgi:hypothetical protein
MISSTHLHDIAAGRKPFTGSELKELIAELREVAADQGAPGTRPHFFSLLHNLVNEELEHIAEARGVDMRVVREAYILHPEIDPGVILRLALGRETGAPVHESDAVASTFRARRFKPLSP